MDSFAILTHLRPWLCNISAMCLFVNVISYLSRRRMAASAVVRLPSSTRSANPLIWASVSLLGLPGFDLGTIVPYPPSFHCLCQLYPV